MDIQIDGQTFSLLPRVSEMLRLLMRNQGAIEQKEYGHISLDYTSSRVEITLPGERHSRKIPRTDLTNGKATG